MTLSRRDVLVGSTALLSMSPATLLEAAAPTPDTDARGWRLPDKNEVEVVDNQWIPMQDGVQLSARLWLPVHAAEARVPVVWEYIPYRKRDLYRAHDDAWGQSLAQYGIAYARVDVRGSGDSQGVLLDEYLDQEWRDGVEVIAWLARQPWSNGSVGMRGISWGGINTLQIAALGPPELKAIMPMCCTDTRYTDDAHYIGGALGLTGLQWGVQFKAVMAMPPDPAVAGEGWREEWHRRLDATPPIIEQWLSHQRNDAFWRRGSVSTDYGRIRCPVYLVDGWVDTYVNSVTRILTRVTAPRKALIGPWAHNYPESASPGPSLQWIYEEVRWWKHWLAGAATAIMEEPMLRAYLPNRTASETYPSQTPGRWIAETSWPSARIAPRRWYLDEGRLSPTVRSRGEVRYIGDEIVGLQKPEWLPFPPEGLPLEQSADDRKSLVFDTAPLEADLEILGHPIARVRVSADQPIAKLALRLCEVTREGRSWLVTYGLLNLTHRDGHETPAPLAPGEPYEVTIELSLIAHRFKAGNRIRLAVSESLWPLVWPSPQIATLTLTLGASSLELPVRPIVRDPPFPIPQNAPDHPSPSGRTPLREAGPDAQGWYEIRQDPEPVSYPIADTGTTVSGALGIKERLRIRRADNNSCEWQGERSGGFKRGDWDCTVASAFRLTSTAESFFIEETLRASEGGEVIFERTNKAAVKRELM
ncbi:MAG TPA: CocE/NonD family hydrolase [Steroidobacteraceae bacterium]|nr:CocE/NonD family hydrolase [Steroidobacteraceae bacterium]